MEHEAFVPVPAETLRQALRDPARVARCVPGLQQDADDAARPLSGRLKLRVGNHTITYRGALHVVEQGRAFVVEGEGTEARGGGSVKVTLTVRPEPTDGGTTLTFTGSTRAEGRLADLAPAARTAAGHRLLDRFAESLAAVAFDDPSDGPADGPAEDGREGPGHSGAAAVAPEPCVDAASEPAPGTGEGGTVDDADAGPAPGEAPAAGDALAAEDTPETDPAPADDRADASGPGRGSVFEVPVPPPSLGPDTEDAFDDESDDDEPGDDVDDVVDLDGFDDLQDLDGSPLAPAAPADPAAEAAHARRTMIGRSAEEVDHAPPRGRYAPTPPPAASGTGAALRWAAPAAALALASAVVLHRVLRRRGGGV
ncbi:SRPBCC domain-containing protein [Streptomyces sp. NPDC005805]|uniref:SRPBCC family protein n=1 Tax=Streptomyces sp. NPDC005805 TaxID=3157068 RepID=UPI0033FA4968